MNGIGTDVKCAHILLECDELKAAVAYQVNFGGFRQHQEAGRLFWGTKMARVTPKLQRRHTEHLL